MISPPNWFLLLWQYSKCPLGLTKFSRIGNKEDLHNSLKISSSHILSPALELIDWEINLSSLRFNLFAYISKDVVSIQQSISPTYYI